MNISYKYKTLHGFSFIEIEYMRVKEALSSFNMSIYYIDILIYINETDE